MGGKVERVKWEEGIVWEGRKSGREGRMEGKVEWTGK